MEVASLRAREAKACQCAEEVEKKFVDLPREDEEATRVKKERDKLL